MSERNFDLLLLRKSLFNQSIVVEYMERKIIILGYFVCLTPAVVCVDKEKGRVGKLRPKYTTGKYITTSVDRTG